MIHYPTDETTFRELVSGKYDLSLLQEFDGITDITVVTFYHQLAELYPKAKFILTVRDKESWLVSLEDHWGSKPVLDDPPGSEVKLKIRRFLRSTVYGCYTFNRDRLSYVYDQHYRNVVQFLAYI